MRRLWGVAVGISVSSTAFAFADKRTLTSPTPHSFTPGNDYVFPPANLKVKQVLVYMRHGDRTPIASHSGNIVVADSTQFWNSLLPNKAVLDSAAELNPVVYEDPNSPLVAHDRDTAPRARLTQRGVAECLAVGAAFRERYVEFSKTLDPILNSTQIVSFSTNYSRTQNTAQMVLTGLFPEHVRTRQHWQIPVFVRSLTNETLLPNPDGECFRLIDLLNQCFAQHHHFPGFDRLEEKVRAEVKEEEIEWSQLREILTCHEAYGHPLPPSVSQDLTAKVIEFNTWEWSQWYDNAEIRRLAIGRLINETFGYLSSAVEHKSLVRFGLFITHDNTIFPINRFFNIPNDTWPLYASSVVLELAQDVNTNDHFVRVLHNDVAVPDVAGHVWVPWAVFSERLQKFSLGEGEYRHLCGKGSHVPSTGRGAAQLNATLK